MQHLEGRFLQLHFRQLRSNPDLVQWTDLYNSRGLWKSDKYDICPSRATTRFIPLGRFKIVKRGFPSP